jgi:hypothetical protein
MKLALILAVAALCGCSTSKFGSWEYGSWLDQVGAPARPPVAMSEEPARALSREAAQLRDRSEAVRVLLAHEADRRQRFRHYEELRDLGDRLAPIERSLRDAGRPVRSAALPPPAA